MKTLDARAGTCGGGAAAGTVACLERVEARVFRDGEQLRGRVGVEPELDVGKDARREGVGEVVC